MHVEVLYCFIFCALYWMDGSLGLGVKSTDTIGMPNLSLSVSSVLFRNGNCSSSSILKDTKSPFCI